VSAPGEPGGTAGGTRRMLAPAKLTVSLRVTGLRSDGYHELDAEMVTLDLADELEFEEGGSGLVVQGEAGLRAEALARDGDDLVGRALAACGRRASVRLTKRIPLGGGLGGGSADAAAVLRWAGRNDPVLAAGLGADVPFCVLGGRARVEGVGERINPLPFEARQYVLVLPPFGVDTAAVYRAWDERPGDEAPNALTAAALSVEPRLARWRDALGELAGHAPRLAGSGSSWFVEGAPPEAGTPALPVLRAGSQTGRLVRVRTVPAGWNGGEVVDGEG
jgi:4-diphosphocytidyl-2-C-methyl-D-erythritol kinase